MKNYKQLLEGLPPKSVVFAFGRFNPPTVGHELLIKVVKKVASTHKADYVIYASRTQDKKKNPLPIDRKIHYLNIMFPGTHFVAANEQVRTFMEAAKLLNKKYKNLIMIAGSDRVQEYTKLLNNYNGKEFKFDTIQVISAGERDPDSDDLSGMSASKMRAAAVKGDYTLFKSGLPSTIRDINSKLLMNDIRHAMGYEAIKEQINLVKDDLREQYFKGEIFNVGDIVESNNELYEIVKRGSNHLLLKEQSGNLISKWIQDVTATQGKEMNEDLTDKTIKPNDKLKVARIIAAFLSVESPESLSNPEQIVNMGLRKARTKSLHKDSVDMLRKMMGLADEVGIKYDTKLLPKTIKESIDSRVTVDTNSNYNAAKGILRYSDFKKLMKMNKGVVEDDSDPDTGIPPAAIELADKELENQGPRNSEVGHAYGHGNNSQLRRRVAKYATESVELEETTLNPNDPHGDYKAKKKALQDLQTDKNTHKDEDLKKAIIQRHADLDKEYAKHKVQEDVASADYRVNPETGRKSRARVVTFANSKMGGKPDDTPNDNEDENEYKRTNKKMAEASEVKLGKKIRIKADQLPSGGNKGFDAFFQEEQDDEMDETDLDQLANSINTVDDVLDAYDDHELAIIDDESGEEIESNLKEEALDEVLSRDERIRAKVRFARSSSKRKLKTRIALKRHSDSATINARARKLAIKLIKTRLTKKDPSKLSVGEKERVERFISARKTIVNRLAMKLVSRVRKIENDRLSHHKYTKR
jgi:hypothetical protein